MAIPRSFVSDKANHDKYVEVEPKLMGFIKNKARTYTAKGGGLLDYEELVQEGRCALMHALGSYDPGKGKALHVYLGRILDNTYRDMMIKVLSPTNCPRIWRRTEEKWERVPYPTLSMDAARELDEEPEQIPDDGIDPETAACNAESELRAKVFLMRLRQRLSPRECEVLECVRQPDAGLLTTARNISNSYNVTNQHIAAYLGISKGQVECAIGNIRRTSSAILMELSSTGDHEAQKLLDEVVYA